MPYKTKKPEKPKGEHTPKIEINKYGEQVVRIADSSRMKMAPGMEISNRLSEMIQISIMESARNAMGKCLDK